MPGIATTDNEQYNRIKNNPQLHGPREEKGGERTWRGERLED